MTKQHLPGPWVVSHNYAGATFIEPARPVRLNATTAGTPIVAEVYTHDDAEHFSGSANARLIAAAPDLLEACQTFAEWLGREDAGYQGERDTPEGECQWREWYDENMRLCSLAQSQARAALARATGDES